MISHLPLAQTPGVAFLTVVDSAFRELCLAWDNGRASDCADIGFARDHE
jgi:hypothetical protein